MLDIVLGSHNAKKLVELRDLLAGSGICVSSLAEIPEAIEVEETGTSFVENARLKATEQARHLGRWVLAEDSGLSVDALGGRPGVYSARYSGPTATDAANNRKLLEELQGVPAEDRSAFYTCQLCLSDPDGEVRLEISGICRGQIATAEAGAHGFGYDPLFLIPEYHRTFGELGPMAKKALSHRSRAMRLLLPPLQRLASFH
ncbi:RdgB/HAM1 family non-canonical purine NTP pyrophosphatase [Candidatus Laterigemmans baculatus]|uniref:RdgB/HAM1 family non-canonical purine NTP pyrophosphatase n=1 Tax=Candidatus Laterigemmans baculatus TaxID=2770505 RepID=UPI0013DBA7C4|nr:RdgB/HAM1 family non-canonical purine NTP pyrophosphatase [Candidatus Laterigemmans baculatus]